MGVLDQIQVLVGLDLITDIGVEVDDNHVSVEPQHPFVLVQQ